MSRLSRRLVLLVLLHHMESCRPLAAPRDAVADAVAAAMSRIVAGFAEHAAHRIALTGFRGVPDTVEAITEGTPEVASRPAVQPRPPRPPRSQRAQRSVRQARSSAIEAAKTSMDAVTFAALNVAQRVQSYDRKR